MNSISSCSSPPTPFANRATAPGEDHAGPHHPLVHQPPCGFRSRVCHAVEGVEHLAAMAHRYHWPRVAALGVTQHPDGAEGWALLTTETLSTA